jgi:Fe-S cluster biosynthesis and repair protein YggX
MPLYSGIQNEETLKGLVRDDFFSRFGYEPNIDNIDFVITDRQTRVDLFSDGVGSSRHYLWAEAKKGARDVFDMLTQLILTCRKTYEKAEHLAPMWLGCFDETQVAFAPFYDVLPIFNETDFNWRAAPSQHGTADFKKARQKVEKRIGAKLAIYNFGSDDADIRAFIAAHFVAGAPASVKSPVTKDNFVQIFGKWAKAVRPFINLSKKDWAEFRAAGIQDGDFFRADVMSENGNTITEKLKIVLENDRYKMQETIHERLFYTNIDFCDGGAAYTRFWNKYERPPAREYRQYIMDRRDLLASRNIREIKGSFFTPKIWADKSKEYIAAVLGANWQNEYYVWDCAAGTGNLLAGLSNEYNVWASDIEQGNVETMQSLIDMDENLRLLASHVFQFDFLNDDFDKLPKELKNIIDDPNKRQKLILYINPPYAEASSTAAAMGTGQVKAGVAAEQKTKKKYQSSIGAATNELSAQFMARIHHEIQGCKLGIFSKLKFVSAQNFIRFRKFFNADYKSGFVVRSDSFDNVSGKFPIVFTFWDLNGGCFPEYIEVDAPEECGKKIFWNCCYKSINDWIKQYNTTTVNSLGLMIMDAPDFQKIHQPILTLVKGSRHASFYSFNAGNFIQGCIYFAVRLCIEPTWLNDRDQFLHPGDDNYEKDVEFQANCLVFTLFHGQNRISANDGINHWTPFAEKEVGAKEKFESSFMRDFLKDKKLGPEAAALMDAGRELWKHYHAQSSQEKTASANASFYDIREFFQGRNDKGVMNTKSDDATYTALLIALREKSRALAAKIQPKLYEYGFLKP